MSFAPTPIEVEKVLKMKGDRRYGYTVSKAVDWLEVWSCRDQQGWILSAHNGRECVPIWPAEAYAQLCCSGAWRTASPQKIGITTLLDRWLPGMAKDNRAFAVFPTPDGQLLVVEPGQFGADVRRLLGSV